MSRRRDTLIDNALNAAVKSIQDALGVEHGDLASHFFGEQEAADFAKIVNKYIDSELLEIAEFRNELPEIISNLRDETVRVENALANIKTLATYNVISSNEYANIAQVRNMLNDCIHRLSVAREIKIGAFPR